MITPLAPRTHPAQKIGDQNPIMLGAVNSPNPAGLPEETRKAIVETLADAAASGKGLEHVENAEHSSFEMKGARHLPKHSKRYNALLSRLKSEDSIPLAEAVRQLKTFNSTKFDQTVEVSTNLGIDPKQSDQNVRGAVGLPNGIGKTVRVAVFAQGENAERARAEGADIVGAEDLAKQIKDGLMNFDVALATPDMMGLVGPLGRILGPRGLMPSPRSGTVTTDVVSAVREFKAGKIEFRNDKGGNVAARVGKLSFSDENLIENILAFLTYLRTLKPSASKGVFIRSITISATMSPGIHVQV